MTKCVTVSQCTSVSLCTERGLDLNRRWLHRRWLHRRTRPAAPGRQRQGGSDLAHAPAQTGAPRGLQALLARAGLARLAQATLCRAAAAPSAANTRRARIRHFSRVTNRCENKAAEREKKTTREKKWRRWLAAMSGHDSHASGRRGGAAGAMGGAACERRLLGAPTAGGLGPELGWRRWRHASLHVDRVKLSPKSVDGVKRCRPFPLR